MDLVAELTELVADEARVTASEAVLEQHGQDLSYHPPQLPDVVVFAASTAEVSAVLAFANGHGVPVVPFGAGSSLGGHARKSSAGYDLTGLFVGSEGTLGVITELTLRLYGLPEHTLAARAVFPTVDAACRAAAGMVAAGVSLTRVELVDEATVRAVN